jgi:hypothetical protein
VNSLAYSDAKLEVRVLPFNGACILGVGADIAHQLARQIAHGEEDAAGDDIALDAYETNGVGHGGVLPQEGCDFFRFMSGEMPRMMWISLRGLQLSMTCFSKSTKLVCFRTAR